MVFTTADVWELTPERGRRVKGPPPERPLLSLIYEASPPEARGKFCGGTSLLHNKKENFTSRLQPNPSEILDKAEIMREVDFHIGVHDEKNSPTASVSTLRDAKTRLLSARIRTVDSHAGGIIRSFAGCPFW